MFISNVRAPLDGVQSLVVLAMASFAFLFA